jgi:hypothetical protein
MNYICRGSEEEHIPLLTLWEYGMSQRSLSEEEKHHMTGCDDCLSLLGLCLTSSSMKQVERRLSDAA